MLRFFSKKKTTIEETSDEVLLERYKQSENSHWLGMLYERYMPMVYGVCLKYLKDANAAEDAVMAIYEEVSHKTLKHDIVAFRGWLHVVARNHCLMALRKSKNIRTDLIEPLEMSNFGLLENEFELEFPQKQDMLDFCLAQLAELQLLCVRLFYFEDRSYKEICDLHALDLGIVRSHIQNGRRNLKICLEKNV